MKVAISGGFQVGGFSLSGKVAASVCAIVSVPAFHLDSTHHAGGLGTVLINLADIGIRHGISVLRSHLLIILASLVCIFLPNLKTLFLRVLLMPGTVCLPLHYLRSGCSHELL